MNTKVESVEYRLDGLKWLVAVALVIGAAVANSLYAGEVQLIIRVLALVVVGVVAAVVAINTSKGQAFWTLLKESQVEVRKVVWPTNAETNQTTMLVAVVVVIMSIILWVLDSAIGYAAKFIIG
jgi:preprotein translocase subunit SecE